MQNFEFPKIIPKETYINEKEVAKVITQYCNDAKIRLTPDEFIELVNTYINKYMKNINKDCVREIAANIINRY